MAAALAKAMGVSISSHSTIKVLEPIVVLREDQLTEKARERLQPMVADCCRNDFDLVFYGTTEHRDRNEGFAAHLWKRDGTTMAIAIWTLVRVKHLVRETSLCALVSNLDDGTIVLTANHRQMLDAPPNYNRHYRPGASVDEIAQIHQRRLQGTGPYRIRRIQKEDVLTLANEHKRRTAEFHIRRGFYVPRPEASCIDAAF